MKNMTIGKKIALGFGALILISALLGAMAVLNMKSVQTQAQTLATQYVPETQIAGQLQNAFSTAMLGVRGYRLTAENTYLETARKAFAEAEKQEQDAQKLADANPELVKLQENLKELAPQMQDYENMVNQLEAANKSILTSRDKLNQSAADFMTNIDKLIVGQKTRQENEGFHRSAKASAASGQAGTGEHHPWRWQCRTHRRFQIPGAARPKAD